MRVRETIFAGDGDPRHGTVNGYGNLRCRCPACRSAHRINFLARAHRLGYYTPQKVYFERLRARRQHGTLPKYRGGCRCRPCRNAARDKKREQRARDRESGRGISWAAR